MFPARLCGTTRRPRGADEICISVTKETNMTATVTLNEDLTALFRRDPGRLGDPYPVYHRLRAEAPLHRRGAGTTTWMLTRYADVAAALRDPRLSAVRYHADRLVARDALLTEPERSQARALRRFDDAAMLTTDPPDHTRLRKLAHHAFTPHAIAHLRTRIQALTDALLDAVIPSGRLEVIADLAYPLPVTVIAEILGVPPADRGQLRRWAAAFEAFLDRPDDITAAFQTTTEFHDYLRGLIAVRRHQPADDVLSALVSAQDQGDMLSEEELLVMCTLLLNAGHVTTTNLIGNGLLALLRNPDQLRLLRDDPALLPAAVEEVLRYDSPVQFTVRTATTDVTFGEVVIRRGDLVQLMLGAANRDPVQFPDPDRFDLTRRDNRHLAFGLGPHFCLGAALARMEGHVVLGTLLRRLPDLRLATDHLEYRPNLAFHGLTALPLSLG
jgi:cytochrome P450